MAITAMVMARKGKFSLLPLLFSPFLLNAADWEVTPNLTIKETFSDNVDLSQATKNDSAITTTVIGLDSAFDSKILQFNMAADYSSLYYSHDSDFDKQYTDLSLNGSVAPWQSGPQLVFDASIDNVPRTPVSNQFSDLISRDTVETQNYSVGFVQNVSNSDFNFNAQANLFDRNADDDIGESDGYNASLNFSNGHAIKSAFWRLNGNYYDRNNGDFSARNYSIEGILGITNSFKFNPFIRYYDEGFSGNALTDRVNDSESLGAGFRWQVVERMIIDLSYNMILANDSDADDYLAATFTWEPTSRTSIFANFNQRFFGDSYQVNISHKSKRMVNTLKYNETIQAFRREDFETVVTGTAFCPIGEPLDINNCLASLESGSDPSQFTEIQLLDLRTIESNRFSINKELAWNSTLKYSRTTFTFNLSNRERQDLSGNGRDKYFNVSLSGERKISPLTTINLTTRFNRSQLASDSLTADNNDYYRSIESSLVRTLAEGLDLTFTLRHLSRSSERSYRNYEENRASLSLVKEF